MKSKKKEDSKNLVDNEFILSIPLGMFQVLLLRVAKDL